MMDWQKLILEMKEKGTSYTDQALWCGVSTNAIQKIAEGRTVEPKANLGLKIMALHKKVMR